MAALMRTHEENPNADLEALMPPHCLIMLAADVHWWRGGGKGAAGACGFRQARRLLLRFLPLDEALLLRVNQQAM